MYAPLLDLGIVASPSNRMVNNIYMKQESEANVPFMHKATI